MNNNQRKKPHNNNARGHRSSQSEMKLGFKTNDLFPVFNNTDLTKAYFGQSILSAKAEKSSIEKKARQEVEKEYKPQLQKS